MRRVTYGGGSFITTDDAAEALLAFTAAAAMNDIAEVVELPGLNEEGTPVLAKLVIGPSSEVLAIPVNVAFEEPDTATAVHTLKQRTAVAGHHVGAPPRYVISDVDLLDFE